MDFNLETKGKRRELPKWDRKSNQTDTLSWDTGFGWVRETGRTKQWMDMGRERLTLGLLLRLGILFTAVCVCIHLYLERGWQGASAPLALRRPTKSNQKWGEQSKMKQVSAEEAEELGKSIKRRISYVHKLKKDSLVRKTEGDTEGPSPRCCPPLQLHRKVCLIYHQLLSS